MRVFAVDIDDAKLKLASTGGRGRAEPKSCDVPSYIRERTAAGRRHRPEVVGAPTR